MSCVLVVGGGGREHALCWRLAQDSEVVCAPGNPGIADVAECVPVAVDDTAALIALAQERGASLVVIGPEASLFAGLADSMRQAGLVVLGPGAAGARLEGDKGWSKSLMRAADVPTAEGQTFSDSAQAVEWCQARYDEGKGVAVKATGPALGKGVVVASDFATAQATILDWMDRGGIGEAGRTLLLEERLVGREFSLLTLASERGMVSLPVAQDYKRLEDDDAGPNTGGMGSFAPADWVTDGLVLRTEELVVKPMLSHLVRGGVPFRGVLFSGLMVVDDKPYCLEYNVRFGDPETQSVVRLVGEGFLDALVAAASGLRPERPDVHPGAAVTVVCASSGYPAKPHMGQPVTIGPLPNGVLAFHAGTQSVEGVLSVSGGRVLGISATGPDTATARALAYSGVEQVRFEGMTFRSDIAGTGN